MGGPEKLLVNFAWPNVFAGYVCQILYIIIKMISSLMEALNFWEAGTKKATLGGPGSNVSLEIKENQVLSLSWLCADCRGAAPKDQPQIKSPYPSAALTLR